MQFTTLAIAAFAAIATAMPTFDLLEEREPMFELESRDAEAAAAAANPTVYVYSDTKCTKLSATLNLGAADSGCITYAPGFLSTKLAANPRTNLAAYLFPSQGCGGNATAYAIWTDSRCNDVSQGGIVRSFIHN